MKIVAFAILLIFAAGDMSLEEESELTLRQQFAKMKAEMKAEMKADVSAVRSELGGKMDSLNAQMSRLQATLDALMAASGQSAPLSVAVPPA